MREYSPPPNHVTCHVSHVTGHVSPVMCPMSRVTCHMLLVFSDKVVKLIDGGSVIKQYFLSFIMIYFYGFVNDNIDYDDKLMTLKKKSE